jgi:hypothetical protein
MHALQRAQRVRQRLDLGGRAAQQHRLQAEGVVQVHVLGRQDQRLVLVLQLGHAGQQVAAMVVVDQDHAGGHVLAAGPFILGGMLTDQVPDGFAAAGQAPRFHQAIKLI